MRALALALAISACSTAPEELPPPQLPQRAGVDPLVAARAEGVDFLAHGSAPMFHLRFYETRITLSLEGVAPLDFPRGEPLLPRWNGEIYETTNGSHRLRVEVRNDRPCPDRPGYVVVHVNLNGAQAIGCGRTI
jgi:hypothetical protein